MLGAPPSASPGQPTKLPPHLCGRTTAYGKRRSNTSLVVRHVITVTGLSANTRYHYRVESEDEAGNRAASADLTFKTAR